MVLATIGGVLLTVAVAIAWDHARALRRLRLARLLDDPRYGEAVDLLWRNQESEGAFLDALSLLVERGIERDIARRNLTRILGFDSESARLALGRVQPTRPACDLPNPWDRKPAPAASSAFILPSANFGRGPAHGSAAAGPR